jgi:hypothetical protein
MPTIRYRVYHFEETILTEQEFLRLKIKALKQPGVPVFPNHSFIKEFYSEFSFFIIVIGLAILFLIILMTFGDTIKGSIASGITTIFAGIVLISCILALFCFYSLSASLPSFIDFYRKRKKFHKKMNKLLETCPDYGNYLVNS